MSPKFIPDLKVNNRLSFRYGLISLTIVLGFALVFFFPSSETQVQATFTSVANGDWHDGATWGNNSPGNKGIDWPDKTDEVIIAHDVSLTGDKHTHTADMVIEATGTLNASCGVPPSGFKMKGGTLQVYGTLNVTHVFGILDSASVFVYSGASVLVGDDFVMEQYSRLNIAHGVCVDLQKDLSLSGTESLIGGGGSLSLDNGGGNDVNFSGGASSANICTGTNVYQDNGAVCTTLHTAGTGSCSAFPVEWLNMQASWEGKFPLLEWTTARETNNQRFIIERKKNQQAFEFVGSVPSQGNSTARQDYQFTDYQATVGAGAWVYRIRQVDFDGTFSFSPQVELFSSDNPHSQLQVYPNPINLGQVLTIRYEAVEDRNSSIQVLNTSGQEVHLEALPRFPGGEIEISTDQWARGSYVVRLISQQADKSVKFFLK